MNNYRKEIDGLRALAIVPVIFFHVGLSGVPGGFVGVDVFFVISGYLISSLLFRQISSNTFSFRTFFARRIGRLLPNLFVVILVTVPIAFLFLPPSQLRNFGWSVIGSSTFTSNFVFALQSNYFASSEIRPLLHTWSLGVEEQFYLFIPVILFLAYKFWKTPKTWGWILIGLTATSFLICLWISANYPQFTYYLLITRLWELGIGTLASLLVFSKYSIIYSLNSRIRDILAWLGIFGLIISFIFIEENSSYPGPTTLIPVLGTALILLFATDKSLVARLLRLRLLVSIGVISYSLYLWHQPIIAFSANWRSHFTSFMPNWLFTGLVVIIIIAISTIAYKFIETPLRRKSHNPKIKNEKKTIGLGILGSILILCIGLYIVVNSSNTSPATLETISSSLSAGNEMTIPPAGLECSDFNNVQGEISCKHWGTGAKKIVIWGDSHAAMLAAVFPQRLFDDPNYSFVLITTNGCPPLAGVKRADTLGNAPNCDKVSELNDQLNYINKLHPEDVLLVGRWTMYLNGWQKQNQLIGETHFLNDDSTSENSKAASIKIVEKYSVTTIEKLNAKHVYFVAQAPDLQFLTETERTSKETIPTNQVAMWHKSESQLIKIIESKTDAFVVKTRELFCGDTFCRIKNEQGLDLYGDDNHFTAAGATLIWQYLLNNHFVN